MIAYSRQLIEQEDIDAVVEALKGDFLTGGKLVNEFEEALARYLGVKYVCVMNSATSALHVAYQIIGLGVGDEIITTPLTFAATSNTAVQCGAKPIFCDIKFDGNIDERKIEALITPQTKAIAPVDFGGNPLPIKAIKALCDKHKLFLIEDASHALGSELDGVKVGNVADMTIFSFHAIKPITTFEGGAIATNNSDFYEKAKLLRSHGIVKKELWNSDMVVLGENYRLSDVACAMGLSQLGRLDNFIQKRNEIAKYYDERFANNPYFFTIPIEKNKKSARHLYPILLDRTLWCSKEEIFKALHVKGLGVQVHYKPVYQFSYYKEHFGEQRLPTAEDFYRAELSIPCHQGMSMEDAVHVADTLLETLATIKGCTL
ncbi:MAG: UDP-4-amino-4,6-dideoxy-N-acetyl-beta-L-altrosamine transaminase [Sulfurospirillaceae bacterium]|nr:UDP-4-amino-4,6-dideoxy-N-acetyl-beta-L-altrosamine transaminase [Sulfurospirillaceae bacterium]